MKFFNSIWLYRIFRFLLAFIFLYSGISKILNPGDFAIIIEAYGLLPDSLNYIAAIFLSWAEIISAILLIFDLRGGLSSILIMMILFIFVLSYGIHLGLDADCGCFGPEDPEGHAFSGLKTALKRDFILVGIIIYLYWWRFKNNRLNFIKLNGLFGGENV